MGGIAEGVGEIGTIGKGASEGSDLELKTHHIVEQRLPNRLRFGKDAIWAEDNLVDLEKSFHREVSKFYSSKQVWLTGYDFSTFRQWMNKGSKRTPGDCRMR